MYLWIFKVRNIILYNRRSPTLNLFVTHFCLAIINFFRFEWLTSVTCITVLQLVNPINLSVVYAVLEQKRKIQNKNPISLNDTDNSRFSRTNYAVLNLPGYEPCEKTGSAEITKVNCSVAVRWRRSTVRTTTRRYRCWSRDGRGR